MPVNRRKYLSYRVSGKYSLIQTGYIRSSSVDITISLQAMQILNQTSLLSIPVIFLLWLVFYASSSTSYVLGKTNPHPKSQHNFLVPPPPPYVLLPDTQYGNTLYDQHIYTADGYKGPAPIKVNKHITYWNGANP